jgi:GNAT superfamily N-acetyltransferase
MSAALRIEPLGTENVQAWTELFQRASSPCYCRWWHYPGVKNDWLARCAIEPETNRAEAEEAVRSGSPTALGLVALDGGQAVGWMKLSSRVSVPKLRGLPIYRGVDLGPDEGVWSIGCFLVDPHHRRRGVAGALVDAAPAFVRARGGVAIEAYPRHTHESEHPRIHDEEAWMGPERLYATRGYARVAEQQTTRMYPVYRLSVVT